jgi:rod shape-determining protein MreC
MLKKVGLIVLNIFILIILTLFLLKLIAFLPAQKMQPVLGDKLLFLQKVERDIEGFFDNVGLTYQKIVFEKELEKKYKVLYLTGLVEKISAGALEHENKQLRQKLAFSKDYGYALFPAQIISRGADNWFNFIVVDKGAADGRKKDMEVINEQGLIGYAYTVFQTSTKILLLTDPLVQISCINQRNGEIGILNGQLTRPLQLNYIGSNSDIKEGDILLSSGQSLRFRKGLPVARITKVNNVRNNYYKNILAEPLADLGKLDIVFFLK